MTKPTVTMNLQKLQLLRQGKRALIAEQIETLEKAIQDNLTDEVRELIEIVEAAALALTNMDEEIISKIDAEGTVAEVTEAGSYNFHLTVKLKKFKRFCKQTAEPSGNTNQSSIITDGNIRSNQQSGSSIPLPSSSFHKLPTLSLPTFNGDLLSYQTFWDSFETTVHNNPGLSDKQKFGYLKSLLEGDAARKIDGFSLTNANYEQALDLLKSDTGRNTRSHPHACRLCCSYRHQLITYVISAIFMINWRQTFEVWNRWEKFKSHTVIFLFR